MKSDEIEKNQCENDDDMLTSISFNEYDNDFGKSLEGIHSGGGMQLIPKSSDDEQ